MASHRDIHLMIIAHQASAVMDIDQFRNHTLHHTILFVSFSAVTPSHISLCYNRSRYRLNLSCSRLNLCLNREIWFFIEKFLCHFRFPLSKREYQGSSTFLVINKGNNLWSSRRVIISVPILLSILRGACILCFPKQRHKPSSRNWGRRHRQGVRQRFLLCPRQWHR